MGKVERKIEAEDEDKERSFETHRTTKGVIQYNKIFGH